ncbi:MAG: hypothetical protein K8F91_16260, partial [Candidatus Obscuribacterales bacterium]|nr:hypothetical protein [Candidatus Obscuribacterales bacterium]
MPDKKTITALITGTLITISSLMTGCQASRPVTVEKAPLVISTRYIEEVSDKSTIPLSEDEEAITKWKFGCKTDIRFDIISKEIIDPEYLVSIKITGVKIILDAPVTIWISKETDPETLAHEKAH